jgi:hypothetical protein
LDLHELTFIADLPLLAVNRAHMETVMAEAIEAIFVVVGKPEVAVRQCSLAMDKWLELVIGPRQTMLGLIINANNLTGANPQKYIKEVLDLLNSTWHPNQCCFKASEAQKLTGKLVRLVERATWVFHLLSHVYLSIALHYSRTKDSCWSHLVSFVQSSKPCKLSLSLSHARIWLGIHRSQLNGQQNLRITLHTNTISTKQQAKS